MKTLWALMIGTLCSCSTSPARVLTSGPKEVPPVRVSGKGAGVLRLMRLVHASVLLDFDGLKVLTDPWFTEKAGYHPGEPLALAIQQLPHLDAVVVSHGHYDHFDIEAFAAYPDKAVALFVPEGVAASARAAGFWNVQSVVPGDVRHAGDLELVAAPAKHNVPEVTWLLRARGFSVYFGGDSLLTSALEEFATKQAPVDLALTSVNGLRVLGKQAVMTSEEAADLVGRLQAQVAVPIHYMFTGGWFMDLVALGYDGSPERFRSALERVRPQTQVRVLSPGEWLTMRRDP